MHATNVCTEREEQTQGYAHEVPVLLAILSSFSHCFILSASLSFLYTRSKKDLFARSSENAAMLSRVL
jgi:hypothetical protein